MHFEDYPPKGIFWQNKMEFDFLVLSGDSRPLLTFALNMRADQSSRWLIRIDHFVTILPYLAFVKCPKIAILRHFFKFCFLKIFGFISLVHYHLSSDSAFLHW